MKHSKYPQYCLHWAVFHLLCFNLPPVMFVPSFTHCALAQNFMFLCCGPRVQPHSLVVMERCSCDAWREVLTNDVGTRNHLGGVFRDQS